MESVQVIVIGAGVVGLATARALSLAGYEVFVLERHAQTGQETSSRNSGVIHSGIYYPTQSLKAQLCVRGRESLYAYCAAKGIDHRRCGKIIVANEEQLPALHTLHRKGLENGVLDLALLTPAEVRQLEPQVRCAGGLFSPSTGIVDAHQLMLAARGDLEAHGGMVVLQTEVKHISRTDRGLTVLAESSGEVSELRCNWLINSAGLWAVPLLHLIDGYPAGQLPASHYAKGNYFACHGVRPFKHLVYPMPNAAGLGIHATLDLDGTTRFGPDVEWVHTPEYHIDAGRVSEFYKAIRDYWPEIPEGCLHPAYAGVRPKLVGSGSAAADFRIEGPASHGIRGLINLLGIESPGLTSSLAIGEYVADLVRRLD